MRAWPYIVAVVFVGILASYPATRLYYESTSPAFSKTATQQTYQFVGWTRTVYLTNRQYDYITDIRSWVEFYGVGLAMCGLAARVWLKNSCLLMPLRRDPPSGS